MEPHGCNRGALFLVVRIILTTSSFRQDLRSEFHSENLEWAAQDSNL